MKTITLVSGACLGLLSVVFGAFGAHALKNILTVEKLTSFESGVRYQMYAALYLLIIGYILKFETNTEKWISYSMIIGTVLFSFSIYLLCMQEAWNFNAKILGPITPIGGVFMLVSWLLLILHFINKSK